MTPSPTGTAGAAPATAAAQGTSPVNITVTHPSTLSAADVLSVVNSTVDQDTPVVLQAIPSASPQVSAYITLGEIGLAVINQIVQKIHTAHASKSSS